MPLLLSFLDKGEQSDFYVRYHTIQLLTALAAGGPYRLQGVSTLQYAGSLPSVRSPFASCWPLCGPRLLCVL